MPSMNLPSKADFDPYGGNLDAEYAWQNFGGLSLDQAYARFCESPETYQEDFMFMGIAAFEFYFEVVDRYLRSTISKYEKDDCQAWILAKCISAQIEHGSSINCDLKAHILDLCAFVRSNLRRFASTEKDREWIDAAWSKLQQQIE